MTHCFYVGSLTDFNVRMDLENIGKAISDDFDLHLLTTKPEEYSELRDMFTIHGGFKPNFRGDMRTLHRYLQQESPASLTTLFMQHDLMIPSLLMTRLHGVPHIYRYTSNDFERYKIYNDWRRPAYYILNNLIGEAYLPYSSKYLVLGTSGRSHLIERGVSVDDVTVLPQPFDLDRYNDPPDILFPVPENVKTALYVGRRSWLKGFDRLEDILPTILKHRPNLHFIIVGCGTEFPDVPSKFHNRIHPVGDVNPVNMPAYFSRSDILLVTSRAEGLPRVIVEALLADTPVLAPSVGEIPDVISNPYSSKMELIQRIQNLEDESTDDASNYTIENLKPKYSSFYRQFI